MGTMEVWMKAFSYLIILDIAYLYAKISIYYRAPLILTEVTFLTFLYQSLVYQRDIGSVAFIDGAVGVIAIVTAFESWLNKKLINTLEGTTEKTKINTKPKKENENAEPSESSAE